MRGIRHWGRNFAGSKANISNTNSCEGMKYTIRKFCCVRLIHIYTTNLDTYETNKILPIQKSGTKRTGRRITMSFVLLFLKFSVDLPAVKSIDNLVRVVVSFSN